MSHKNTHVLLITHDAHLRHLVRQQRPATARLKCVTLAQMNADAGHLPNTQQLWLDLDSAPVLPAKPWLPAERYIYLHSAGQQVPPTWPAGTYIHKPRAATTLAVLWAGVATAAVVPAHSADNGEAAFLPSWLLEFHELNLKKFCRLCVTRLSACLNYEQASLYLRDFRRNVLTLAETNHARPVERVLRWKEDRERLMPAVARTGKPLATERIHRAYEKFALPRAAPPHLYADEACLIAPLVSRNRLWGVLNFSGRTAAVAPPPPESLQAIFAFLGGALRHARLYDRVRTEARVDGLTGLFNYRWLAEVLAKEIRRAQRFHQPLSLLMLDLDGLKNINDRFGHPAGNFVLQQTARRITSVLRQFDTAVRVGGDEFLAMLPATDLAGAEHVAQRVLHALRADAPVFHGTPLPITASLGVTQWQEGVDGNQLVETADQAMYAAKRQGRNQIVSQIAEPAPAPATPPQPVSTGWQPLE